MEHQSPFVGGGRRARTTHGKADATTPVNGYPPSCSRSRHHRDYRVDSDAAGPRSQGVGHPDQRGYDFFASALARDDSDRTDGCSG